MSVDSAIAFLLDEDLSMSVGPRRLSDPAEDEAVIDVEWAGLCGSDLHVMRTGQWVTAWPATLGHEVFGRVRHAPLTGDLPEGIRVVADSRIPCGHCERCRSGERRACAELQFLGEARPGGFASACVIPSSMLIAVPEDLDGATAVLAEPLAVAMHGLSRLSDAPGRVAVLGHGPLGALMHIELRRRHPDAEIDIVERAALRAELARALGARCAGAAAELPARSYDTVIDAAGYGGSLSDALALCAGAGQILLLGLGFAETAIVPAELVERRLRLTGANAFIDELPQAVAQLAAEGWRYRPIVTDAITLPQLPQTARDQLSHPEAIKVLVCP